MKVYTVTIIDDRMDGTRENGPRRMRSTQHRRTSVYDRFARAVASAMPPTIDIRL